MKDDTISRQAAIVAICKAGCSLSNPCRVLCPDALAVQEVPSTNQWIPVTERLPDNEKDDWVLAVVREKDTGFCWIPRVMEYREGRNDWLFQDDGGWLSEEKNEGLEVVAWMPLPEPYEGEE